MRVSFDFDGTLTEPKIREVAIALLEKHDVYILTSRFSDTMKDVFGLAQRIGVKPENVYCTNLKDKGDWIKENDLELDIHFDDDYFQVDSINRKTNTMAILVDLTLHPSNTDVTEGGLIIPKSNR